MLRCYSFSLKSCIFVEFCVLPSLFPARDTVWSGQCEFPCLEIPWMLTGDRGRCLGWPKACSWGQEEQSKGCSWVLSWAWLAALLQSPSDTLSELLRALVLPFSSFPFTCKSLMPARSAVGQKPFLGSTDVWPSRLLPGHEALVTAGMSPGHPLPRTCRTPRLPVKTQTEMFLLSWVLQNHREGEKLPG